MVKMPSNISIQRATTSRQEILRAIRAMFQEGDVIELRALDVQKPNSTYRVATVSGYFTDVEALADAALEVGKTAKAVYVTLNKINPDLLARSHNKIRSIGKSDPLTADHNITDRRLLLIDADPKRDAGISSSEKEHAAALTRIQQVRDYLVGLGWPEPIVGDSGNGGHLLFRINLPADDKGLVKRVLKGLAARFDDEVVQIDTTVDNPSRISKLYGTVARKGDDFQGVAGIEDRPHRLSRILSTPDEFLPVVIERLEAVALHEEEPPSRSKHSYDGAPFDLDEWIEKHNLDVRAPKTNQYGTIYIFNTCPWSAKSDDPHEDDGAAFVGQRANGALYAGCHHSRCSDAKWETLKAMYEPERKERATPVPNTNNNQKKEAPKLSQGRLLSTVKAQKVDWLWEGRIPLGKLTLIDGEPDKGKSLITIDLIARITTGRAMPDGTPGVKGGAVIIAIKDDAASTIVPRLEAAKADTGKVLDLSYVQWWNQETNVVEEVPFSMPMNLGVLREAIEQVDAKIVVIDPFMAVLDHGLKSRDDQDMRKALTPLSKLAEETGCAIVIIRHFNKGASDNPLLRGAGSMGIIGAVRSGLFVAQCPDTEDGRVLAVSKHNLSKKVANLTYYITEEEKDRPFVKWTGVSNYSSASLLGAAKPSEHRLAIIKLLRESNRPLTRSEIREGLGGEISDSTLGSLLSRMNGDREIESTARGMYTLPKPSSSNIERLDRGVATTATSGTIATTATTATLSSNNPLPTVANVPNVANVALVAPQHSEGFTAYEPNTDDDYSDLEDHPF